MLAVDRHRRPWPKVSAFLDVLLPHLGAELCGFGNGVFAVLVGDVVFADDDLVVDPGLIDVSEYLDDAAERPARRCRPARDLDNHHVSWSGSFFPTGGHFDIHDQATVERHDEARAVTVLVEATDNRL